MAIVEPVSLAVMDEIRALARQLDQAGHRQKGELVQAFMDKFGWSRAKVYKQLEAIGWSSGRKVRADRGTTKQDMVALQAVSAAIKYGVRENGKATMQTPNAISMLSQNNMQISVSASRINTLLRERQMDLAAQKRDTPAQEMQSLHPNHVHQVDPSLCLVYYLPDGTQHIMRDDEFYKNKLENIAKIKLKVWRYTLTDHYSASIVVRYYQAKGESQANLFDFLLYAWSKKPGTVLHGVPKIILWDKGSANTAGAIKNALKSLDVRAIEHKAKNPRAKGSVENGNNLVECLFESRLRFEPVENVDQLNASAEAWFNAYNANAIPNYDARLKRKYMAVPQVRYGLWQTIRKEQLRELPDVEVCRMLLSGSDVEREVSQTLQVSFKHPATKQREFYDVSTIPGIYVKQLVKVSPLIYGNAQVMVSFENYKGEETSYILEPIKADRRSGFASTAAVIGDEFKSAPDTVVEHASKASDRLAFPGLNQEETEKAKARGDTPFGGLDAHSHLKHVSSPDFMDRPGEMLNVPNRLQLEAKPLSSMELKIKLRAMLGRALTPEDNAILREKYAEGALESQVEEVIAALNNPSAPTLKLAAG